MSRFFPRPVHFVFAESGRNVGSTVMRGEQLAALAGPGKRRVSFTSATQAMRGSILFLTKNALKTLTPDSLEELAKRKNTLLFDVVDEAPPATTLRFADGIIAASATAQRDLERDYPNIPVFLVNHHVDLRLNSLALPAQQDEFRAGYFGEFRNTLRTDRLEAVVEYIQVDTAVRSDDWLQRLPEFSFHFAIRSLTAIDRHKPFLKGFTAARCGANILIQDTEEEAVSWLGADYPFLLHGEATEANLLASLAAARESFGSKTWHDGLDVMRSIADKTSDARIAGELERMFAAVD